MPVCCGDPRLEADEMEVFIHLDYDLAQEVEADIMKVLIVHMLK